MEQVGTIYQMWRSEVSDLTRYHELKAFKQALKQEGFRWQTSSAHSKLEIHEGGDILSNGQYKVGELDGNKIYVFGSSKLEEFCQNYPK